MNLIAHILASYLTVRSFTNDPNLILPGVLIGILPDIDHVSHTLRAIKTGRYGTESRSRFHELFGLGLFSAAIMFLSYAYGNFAVMFFPLLVHYLLDFLTRPTRPFYPFNNTIMHFSLYPKTLKNMIIADILFTGGLLIWIIL
jgi:membrane-bound metal-dependent hydrolase YbcI (DUF457 family)